MFAVVHRFDYAFPENGLRAYAFGELIGEESITEKLGEDNLKEFINYVLRYLSTVDCPVKRCGRLLLHAHTTAVAQFFHRRLFFSLSLQWDVR